jgi:hypothetical protein
MEEDEDEAAADSRRADAASMTACWARRAARTTKA